MTSNDRQTPTPEGLTFATLVAARADDDHVALRFEDRSWTWREVVLEARLRAALVARHLDGESPAHVGLAMENSAEHLFWWLGAALHGTPVVGLNPTRRGAELARDIDFTRCRLLVVDSARSDLVDGAAHGVPDERVLRVDEAAYADRLADLEPAPLRVEGVAADTILSLIFTSGTTADPKAVICTQRRLGRIAVQQVQRRGLTGADVFYVAMPMFHSNAIMAGVAPAVCTGGTIVLRRRFSASGWLPDVRRHGVTFFNYVGKPLSYVLATPEQPDDADNTLRIAFGNEAAERDIAEFARRFDCTVVDAFGSSEGEIRISRTEDTPPGSLGRAPEGTVVLDPETLQECPPARFDGSGCVLNAEEATGEIVNKAGAALFEGYWDNPEADAARVRHGWVWSGDLAYRDEEGFFYFAGRTSDWLRVDGENVATAPIERLLSRFTPFDGVAVLAAPDERVGDAVLAVVELREGAALDPVAFGDFLAAQSDLASTWVPRWVKVVPALPRTPSTKVLKRGIDTSLRDGEVIERDGRTFNYRRPPSSG